MPLTLPILYAPADAARHAWIQLIRTHAKMTRKFEKLLDRHGLTMPQFDVLATLSTGDGITQQELAERLLVTKGNVTGLLDRMEKNGWVQRRTDPADRRSNRIHMTAKGRRLLAKVLPQHQDLLAQCAAILAPADIHQLLRTLETLERRLDTFDPDKP